MIRPILLLSFFIAFTANNIAQEQQYRIWFNDKPESVHSVDEPEKFLSEQAIAHREKQNIPIDSTDLPIDPVRLKKLSELGARILATSKWLNTATIALTDTTDLSAIASLSFVKKHESLGVAVQPVSNLKKRQKQIESESENPYGDAALQIEVHNGDELHRAGFTGKGMTIAVIDGGFFKLSGTRTSLTRKWISRTEIHTARPSYRPCWSKTVPSLSVQPPMPHTGSCARKIPIRNIRQKKIIGWRLSNMPTA